MLNIIKKEDLLKFYFIKDNNKIKGLKINILVNKWLSYCEVNDKI